MKKVLYIVIFVFCLFSIGKSQDIHFTQFDYQPLFFTPGAAGNFDGDHRFNLLYRNQWATIEVPYNSIGASYDAIVLQSKRDIGFLSTGAAFFFDQAGDGRLQTIQFQVPLSYHFTAQLNNNAYLSFGLGGYIGFIRKALQTNNLQFDAQYNNGVFNANLPSFENFDALNYIKPDIGVGYHFGLNIQNKFKASLGFGMHHLIPIRESFIDDGQKIVLPMRFSIPSKIHYQINSKWAIQLLYIYQEQRTVQEHAFMSIASFYLKNNGPAKTALEFGGGYRIGDAVTSVLRYKKNNWWLGMSYDINVSPLRQATNTYGGIEIGGGLILKRIDDLNYKDKRKCFVF